MCRSAVNIVGVGNTLMGDDGVGPAAIERLRRRRLPEGLRLWDAGLAVSDILGMLDPAEPLIVVDAVRARRAGAAPAGPPGSIYKVRLDPAAPDEGAAGMLSLHELSVLPALRLEALTGRVFRDVLVLGVEPGRIAWGEGLSPAVEGALDRLVDAVLEEAGARCAGAARGDQSP